ncbi:MAG: universal stress protein [Candidatus Melainabacteria bacterium]|nr:universal stress protein [Candidatus Melainabacteria bacterium]
MKILVAVDDMSFADALSDFIIHCELSKNSEFRIMHVVEPVFAADFAVGFSAEQRESLKEERHRLGRCVVMHIDTQLQLKFPQASISEIVVDGFAKTAIIENAASWGADLIVMGSHGRGSVERLFLGSVSLSVLAQAPCSVAIVRLHKLPSKAKLADDDESTATSDVQHAQFRS